VGCPRKRKRVIRSHFDCAQSILLAFGNIVVFYPTFVLALSVTGQGYAIRCCKTGIERNRLPRKPQSFFISLAAKAPKRLDSTVVQVKGVEAFGRFAPRPVDFRLFKARRDCSDYARCHFIL
jgi:hypothetical protein